MELNLGVGKMFKWLKNIVFLLLITFQMLNVTMIDAKNTMKIRELGLGQPLEWTIIEDEPTISYTFTKNNEQVWESDSIAKVLSSNVEKFLELLQETMIEEVSELNVDELVKEYELIINNSNDTLLFAHKEDQSYLIFRDKTYKLLNAVPIIEDNFVGYFTEPLSNSMEEISEFILHNDFGQLTFNQQHPYTKIETAPFISQWYVHTNLDTVLSVEYKIMEKIKSTLINLYSVQLEEPIQTINQSTIQIDIKGKDTYSWLISTINDEFSQLLDQKNNIYYLVRNKDIDVFNLPLLNYSDNFICLLPLDAVNTITIESQNNKYRWDLTHNLHQDDTQIKANHTFEINGKEIEEETARKLYQYLALLNYQRVATESELNSIKTTKPVAHIQYVFSSDKRTHERNISFYDLNESEFVVKKDDIMEFVAKKESFITLFEQMKLVLQ